MSVVELFFISFIFLFLFVFTAQTVYSIKKNSISIAAQHVSEDIVHIKEQFGKFLQPDWEELKFFKLLFQFV